ncbi:MAG: DUF4340 domain-containing protein [Alphaproteobacteria bacterium]|nr:DUF4340 domain-containing protein [Alphaproteobacteria bacterium]
MITARSVGFLGTATLAVALGAAVAVIDRVADTRTSVETRRLLPDFARRSGEAHQIEVIRAEDNDLGSVSLVRSGDGWILEQRDGYPARTDVVRKLLFDLGQLDVIETKTADPGRFERLDLRDVAQNGSKASRLVVSTAQGDVLADLHVGKRRDSLQGGEPMVYVRPTDGTQTYLAEGELEMRGKPHQWLFREVVNVPQADIRRASITAADGTVVELERITDDGRDFRVVNILEGRKIDSQYAINNAATVLDKLLFDDVRSAEGVAFDPSLGSARFVTKDGLVFTVQFAPDGKGEDGKSQEWLRVMVEMPESASDETKAFAEQARAQVDGWAYRLSGYEMERLRATMATLTKPIEGS